MILNRLGKEAARLLLHRGGALHGVRYWNRGGIRILMYHDFPFVSGLQEALAKQCAHIARYYNVVTLTDIGRHLREGTPLPKNALAVTVDDGNRDFLVNGYPVFRAHKIPVTVYLVSGFLDGDLWFWWDQISYLVESSRRSSFEFSLGPGHAPQPFPIETPQECAETLSIISEALKKKSAEERLSIIRNDLARRLEVELPIKPPDHLGPITWSEARHVAENGVDFGAHTVTHPILSHVENPEDLFHEIAHSKKRIEEELHRPVPHFCYPNGRVGDFSAQTIDVVRRCGFETAVTAEHGMNSRQTPPFELRRLSVDPFLPEFYFQERIAGLHAG